MKFGFKCFAKKKICKNYIKKQKKNIKMEISELVIYLVIVAIGLYVPVSIFKWQKNKSAAYQGVSTPQQQETQYYPQPPQPHQQQHRGGPISKPQQFRAAKPQADNNLKNFSHPWMVAPFRGHTGPVQSIDFSSNNKYIATCAEDAVIHHQHQQLGATHQYPDEQSIRQHEDDNIVEPSNSSTCSDDSHNSKGSNNKNLNSSSASGRLTRRQRKKKSSTGHNTNSSGDHQKKQNNDRKYSSSSSSSSSSSPLQHKRQMPMSEIITPPLRMHTKLNMKEHELVEALKRYVYDEKLLKEVGYPVQWKDTNLAVFERKPFNFAPARCYVNATELPSAKSYSGKAMQKDGRNKERDGIVLSGDSGQGSATSSSPPSMDSDTYDEDRLSDVQSSNESIPQMIDYTVRECVRCRKTFKQTMNGDYLKKQDDCYWHPGKRDMPCCDSLHTTAGCMHVKQHVWSGYTNGFNGPFEGYVITQPCEYLQEDGTYGLYALDCEMCYTARGLELAKVTLVTSDGRRAYESFVRPQSPIVDYNTQFSGITNKDMSSKSVKSFSEVQKDLLEIINDRTIIIGHALENDMRALKLIHKTVVDTSLVFPHFNGLPARNSLKSLAKLYLQRNIQNNEAGHDSLEDARACLELMLKRVRADTHTKKDAQNVYA